MKKVFRTLVVLAICLSGWGLVSVVSLPAQSFGWELFAEAYGEIFSDGFEIGSTDRWTRSVGVVESLVPDSSEDLTFRFRINESGWPGKTREIITLAAGVSERDAPIFIIEGRRVGRGFEIRGRAVSQPNVWVETPWRELESSYEAIDLEWRRALDQTEDGLVYLSVDDQLLLWLVDLDNAHLPLRQIQLYVFDGVPAVVKTAGTYRHVE